MKTKTETSLKETIYNAILEDIIALEYRPGEILNEKTLIEKYNCSKSPVREALLALCADNVLRNIPRYGYEVVRLTMEDIHEMIQFRYILESGILQLRMNRFTPSQMERLEAIDMLCTESAGDLMQHWELNTQFHRKLIGYCGNSFAVEELDRCMNRLKRAYAQCHWGKEEKPVDHMDTRHHARLLSCIRSQDTEGALHALRDDLNDFGGLDRILVE